MSDALTVDLIRRVEADLRAFIVQTAADIRAELAIGGVGAAFEERLAAVERYVETAAQIAVDAASVAAEAAAEATAAAEDAATAADAAEDAAEDAADVPPAPAPAPEPPEPAARDEPPTMVPPLLGRRLFGGRRR